MAVTNVTVTDETNVAVAVNAVIAVTVTLRHTRRRARHDPSDRLGFDAPRARTHSNGQQSRTTLPGLCPHAKGFNGREPRCRTKRSRRNRRQAHTLAAVSSAGSATHGATSIAVTTPIGPDSLARAATPVEEWARVGSRRRGRDRRLGAGYPGSERGRHGRRADQDRNSPGSARQRNRQTGDIASGSSVDKELNGPAWAATR